jgi:hypothetical protein
VAAAKKAGEASLATTVPARIPRTQGPPAVDSTTIIGHQALKEVMVVLRNTFLYFFLIGY